MEDDRRESLPQEEAEEVRYIPRPRWQVWLVRIGLALFLLFLAGYYVNIARGGM